VPHEWGLAKKWGGESGELNSSSTSERERCVGGARI